MSIFRAAQLALLLVFGEAVAAQEPQAPAIEHFAVTGSKIGVRIFRPAEDSERPAAVLVLFHGGGWSEGEAHWMDAVALQHADLGMVAISVDYRLSQNGVTPFDAVSDARNAIRWVRHEAARLGVDPDRVVALGTSAGAHLAVSTAIFNEPWGSDDSSVPNALILRSPAVSVENSIWFQKLSGGVSQAAALSPVLHVRSGLPPMLILQGEMDNVTLAADAKRFCQRMAQNGNSCELKTYPDVGHLFTRNLTSQEIPDYAAIDRAVAKDASDTGIAFLKRQGFIVDPTGP
ncbi:MAG: alpha/beta hydrolase [Pseudomonadota bacterium]|nr:alpha/beta hydrolase [Pseudomonadota bacterium]